MQRGFRLPRRSNKYNLPYLPFTLSTHNGHKRGQTPPPMPVGLPTWTEKNKRNNTLWNALLYREAVPVNSIRKPSFYKTIHLKSHQRLVARSLDIQHLRVLPGNGLASRTPAPHALLLGTTTAQPATQTPPPPSVQVRLPSAQRGRPTPARERQRDHVHAGAIDGRALRSRGQVAATAAGAVYATVPTVAAPATPAI